MDLYIIKVGGSAATFKETSHPKARADVIRQVALEIKKARKKKKFKLVLVHGAGPFGHKHVKEYGIERGVKSKKDVEGFVTTHASMEDLNKIFLNIFREEGLLAFPVQTSAVVEQNKRKITEFNLRPVKWLLDLDWEIIPLMYGDMVKDESWKASVVSGDALIPVLAKELKAKKVFLGANVEGVYAEGKVVKEISEENFGKILEHVGEAKTVDVTEGMRGKLLELKNNLNGIPAVIFNLRKKNNLYKLLNGIKGIGTRIEF